MTRPLAILALLAALVVAVNASAGWGAGVQGTGASTLPSVTIENGFPVHTVFSGSTYTSVYHDTISTTNGASLILVGYSASSNDGTNPLPASCSGASLNWQNSVSTGAGWNGVSGFCYAISSGNITSQRITVSFTGGGQVNEAAINIWSLKGYNTGTPIGAADTYYSSASAAMQISVGSGSTKIQSSGSMLFGVAYHNYNATTRTAMTGTTDYWGDTNGAEVAFRSTNQTTSANVGSSVTIGYSSPNQAEIRLSGVEVRP